MSLLTSPMRDALRLTRAGKLADATRVIQASLGREKAVPDLPIDVEFEIVEPETQSRAAGPGPLRRLLHSCDGSAAREQADTRNAPNVVSSGRFVSGTFASTHGTRSYKLWIPAERRQTQPAYPLIVMLHGCTQDADDFAAGTGMNALADREGCYVLYPIQSASANAQKCWQWFRPQDQMRDNGEPALLAEMTRRIISEYPIDAQRVFVAGLSAGAAMAVILGNAYSDLFTAVGAHSGLAHGAANNVPSAFSAMSGRAAPSHARVQDARVAPSLPRPGIVIHGDGDRTVVPTNSDSIVAQWTATHGGIDSHDLTQRVDRTNAYTCRRFFRADGTLVIEHWIMHGVGHAWSGGNTAGTYTEPRGEDASRAMLAFFLGVEVAQ